MIPNGKKMNWHGHHLTFESEDDWCRGCFFADKDECPDCDEGAWVEDKPNPWHTGTPTEEGWYVIAFIGANKRIEYASAVWCYGEWDARCKVVAWMPIPPFETKPHITKLPKDWYDPKEDRWYDEAKK